MSCHTSIITRIVDILRIMERCQHKHKMMPATQARKQYHCTQFVLPMLNTHR